MQDIRETKVIEPRLEDEDDVYVIKYGGNSVGSTARTYKFQRIDDRLILVETTVHSPDKSDEFEGFLSRAVIVGVLQSWREVNEIVVSAGLSETDEKYTIAEWDIN